MWNIYCAYTLCFCRVFVTNNDFFTPRSCKRHVTQLSDIWMYVVKTWKLMGPWFGQKRGIFSISRNLCICKDLSFCSSEFLSRRKLETKTYKKKNNFSRCKLLDNINFFLCYQHKWFCQADFNAYENFKLLQWCILDDVFHKWVIHLFKSSVFSV